MKNKNGFTLIELLAVIAILAILMLMVTPNILDMFNSGKDKAFITSAQSLWKAAEEEHEYNVLNGKAKKVYCSKNLFASMRAKDPGFENNCQPLSTITDTNVDYYVKTNGDKVSYILVADEKNCIQISNNISNSNVYNNNSNEITNIVTCPLTDWGASDDRTCKCSAGITLH